jgi:hypothetical protein
MSEAQLLVVACVAVGLVLGLAVAALWSSTSQRDRPFAHAALLATALVVFGSAALIAGAALVWLGGYKDNSESPTPYWAGIAGVFGPAVAATAIVLARDLRSVARVPVALGLSAAAALTITLGVSVALDAAECSDDDCVTAPLGIGLAMLAAPTIFAAGATTLLRPRGRRRVGGSSSGAA